MVDEGDSDKLEQPDIFDLELDLVRWVKQAIAEPSPPLMAKPAGNVTQFYGLDSKSRWREAICVMMIYSEPGMTNEHLSQLGQKLANLFKQDAQLWDVKAKQLKSWVDRGLINVKLLDRTLAYFQNQSSYLQYIKTLKKPLPKIESPGFPGTQWNQFYWKDQTVMLLMLETDFPDGKNPEFCAKLFREDTGSMKLKMEQFKRWLEKGKHDPLPEYYNTGKNCSVCGVFLFDTKSYLKHMKRNHGYKIKEKDKQLLKTEKKEKQEKQDEAPPRDKSDLKIPTKAELKRDSFDMIISGSLPSTSKEKEKQLLKTEKREKKDDEAPLPVKSELKIPTKAELKKDPFEMIITGSLPSTSRSSIHHSKPETDSDLDDDDDHNLDPDEKFNIKSSSRKEPETVVSASSRRRGGSKPEFKDELVTCPECDFQCLHSKIVSHLKKCTKKVAQKVKSKPEKVRKEPEPKSTKRLEPEVEVKKPKESDIVKKVFLKKFEAQKSSKIDYFSDSDVETPSRKVEASAESDHDLDKPQPSLKLKFSRKDSSSDLSHFEVSNDNIDDVDKPGDEPDVKDPKDTSLSAILRNLNSDRSDPKLSQTSPKLPQTSPKLPPKLAQISPKLPQITPPKDKPKPLEKNDGDSSDDEVIPQKSFRLHSFIESIRTMHARLPKKKEEPEPKEPQEPTKPGPDPIPTQSESVSPVESANLKHKWLQSLENRSKVKPVEPSTVVNKIQSDIAQLRDKNSLIYSKAKLKSYPEPTPSPIKPVSAKEPLTETLPEKPKVKKPPPTKGSAKEYSDVSKVEYHDGRPSLRKGKMIPCPICGAEYAIADNLQKHIDKDHFGETDRVFLKRVKPKDSKEKDKSEPSSKKKKKSSVVIPVNEDDEDDLFGNERPTLDTSTAEEKFDSLMASSGSEKQKKVKVVEEKEEEKGQEKLTEYEIFQKLQLTFGKAATEKKKVECKECGKLLPVNTIKRHLQKHEKEAQMAELQQDEDVPTLVEKKSNKKPKPKKPKKVKRQETKHLKEEQKHEEDVVKNEDKVKEQSEDHVGNLPCPIKKMIMKRHLMKHEDPEKPDEELKEEVVPDKPAAKGRKKINCNECDLSVAPNVFKRHLEKHSKMKNKAEKKSVDDTEFYAPIEITPTKEYWEYEKEKNDKSLDFPSDGEPSAEETEQAILPYKKARKEAKSKSKNESEPIELINKSIQDLKESEKSRNTSEEESESESPLEAAIRKVVSYRMTPKQALSYYKLTAKELFGYLLGESDEDKMSILTKVNMSAEEDKEVIEYCRENESELSYRSVINKVKELKTKEPGQETFNMTKLEAYRFWYAFRKKHDLKITAKKK